MPKYRINSVADLARQMQFTPLATRAAQVTSAEGVLGDIDPSKAYPFDWLIFRITGYRPKNVSSDLLTGLALQHDLGLLIEQLSESLNQRTDDLDQPVLSLEEASEKFNITSKTLQRWRRRGLSGRRLTFPDGKRRIGFLLPHLERFLAGHGRQVIAAANFAPIDADETEKIRAATQRLAGAGCSRGEIARRLARRFNRSLVMVERFIPEGVGGAEILLEMASKIWRRYRHGVGLSELSHTFGYRKSSMYWAIMDERLSRIQQKKAKFIDDALYHQHDAEAVIEAIAKQEPITQIPGRVKLRDSSSILASLSDHPILTPTQERALFLKFNFHKYQFVLTRRRLDERRITHRTLATIERHLARANEVRNEIVRSNLRLLVSAARRHARGCVGLMDLISDGTLTLMRAVEGFDFHKGHHFATYASFGLMKEFARSSGKMIARHTKSASLEADVADASSHRAGQILLESEHLSRLMAELNDAERKVLRLHYGLDGTPATGTYRQTARELGMSPQQVRKIEEGALIKLRAIASSPL